MNRKLVLWFVSRKIRYDPKKRKGKVVFYVPKKFVGHGGYMVIYAKRRKDET